MPSEFDNLTSLSDWSAKLVELLSASRAAAEQPDDIRLAVVRRLTDFIAHSYPATPEIHRLDELASAAARALAEHVSSNAIDRIASRTALLEILAGELDAIRSRADSGPPPSASSIANVASTLTAIAEDAKAIARFRAESAENAPEIRARLARLATTLTDLHASFLALSSIRPEPEPGPPGTVIPDSHRANP
jgi:hypothetical protein